MEKRKKSQSISKKKQKKAIQKHSRAVASKNKKSSDSRKKNKLFRKKRINRRKKIRMLLLEFLLTILVFCLLLVPLFIFVVQIPKVSGYAMTPTLMPDQRVVVRVKGKIKRFSQIYFEVPNRGGKLKNIRRVIGLPGERVEYKDDILYINGQEKSERFLSNEIIQARKEGYQLTDDFSIHDLLDGKYYEIPEGYFLVLGDNRTFSVDSRTYGLVAKENIIGTVILLL